MAKFFKTFGKGILYVLVLPILLVVLAIYAVIAFFVFIVLGIKAIILFFTGRSLNDDLPEDKEAKRRLAAMEKQNSFNSEPQPSPSSEQTTNVFIPQNDPFYYPEYAKPEEEQRPIPEEEVPMFEDEPEEVKKEEQIPAEEDIPFEENHPNIEHVEESQIEINDTVDHLPTIQEEIDIEGEPVFEEKTPKNLQIDDEKENDDADSGVDLFY